jgi:hypothetical protein
LGKGFALARHGAIVRVTWQNIKRTLCKRILVKYLNTFVSVHQQSIRWHVIILQMIKN